MAPALIETITQKPEGGFGWSAVAILHEGEHAMAQTPLSPVTVQGTETGFSVDDGEKTCIDRVDVGDTDEWDLPTTVRIFTDEHDHDIRFTAMTEEAAEAMLPEEKK